MDTTPQPLAPDLQASLRHLRRLVLGGAAALVLLAGAVGLATPADAAETSFSHGSGGGGGKVSMQDLTVAGDPSQWGVAIGKDPELPVSGLTRHVNEYEGQHR